MHALERVDKYIRTGHRVLLGKTNERQDDRSPAGVGGATVAD
jgi:hypothetical protein